MRATSLTPLRPPGKVRWCAKLLLKTSELSEKRATYIWRLTETAAARRARASSCLASRAVRPVSDPRDETNKMLLLQT